MEWTVTAGVWLTLAFFCVAERWWPARREAWDYAWLARALVVNALQISAVWVASVTFNRWLPHHTLALLPRSWPTPIAAVVGAGAYSLAIYGYHRAQHRLPLLWRMHQLHHSPTRLEALSTNYAHPLEYLSNSLVHSVLAFSVLGLTPLAAALSYGLAATQNFFIHANLRSPYWLGYFLQRPEMHRVHHQYKHHRQNYGLPLWDLMFGTWMNPRERVEKCGFTNERERRVVKMLLLEDVHATRR